MPGFGSKVEVMAKYCGVFFRPPCRLDCSEAPGGTAPLGFIARDPGGHAGIRGRSLEYEDERIDDRPRGSRGNKIHDGRESIDHLDHVIVVGHRGARVRRADEHDALDVIWASPVRARRSRGPPVRRGNGTRCRSPARRRRNSLKERDRVLPSGPRSSWDDCTRTSDRRIGAIARSSRRVGASRRHRRC